MERNTWKKISILLTLADAKNVSTVTFFFILFYIQKLFLQQVCIISIIRQDNKVKLRGNDTSRRDRETEREEQISGGGPGPASAEAGQAGQVEGHSVGTLGLFKTCTS